MKYEDEVDQSISNDIAVIGMSGRFPGAGNIEKLWQNVCAGIECITHFSDEELLRAGVTPDTLRDPAYVKAGAVLDDIELFDASFFGLSPNEAAIMDPQQRLFLEEVWNVIECAGYNPETYPGSIGLFAGSGISTYLLNNIYTQKQIIDLLGPMQVLLGNDKDSLTTRIAYLLNLTGPCYTVQTYCSTSLVAVSIACSSLLNGECDMALAGGVAISVPHRAGYYYQEGAIASPDARCKAFDATANGAPLGNGVAVILLKRLENALEDGDTIHAIIKGSAINNDGSLKAGYTAPSMQGQANVLVEAMANAGVKPGSIRYIEAHGTGTPLGDAIELAALIKAFSESTTEKSFCALGSIKTNIGHLDRAAGVTGLIKTVFALKHKCLPPSLNYTTPNPQIDLQNSPFYINTQLTEWKTNGEPRRAGVSAFGIGGTNAHVVLEEAPVIQSFASEHSQHLLLLSAKTASALETATDNLKNYLSNHQAVHLADIAYTLQVGRKSFSHRRLVFCTDILDAIAALAHNDELMTEIAQAAERPVALLLGDIDDRYYDIAQDLYTQEPVFRREIDHCCKLLNIVPRGDCLRELLSPLYSKGEVQVPLSYTAQFIIQYTLGNLFLQQGVIPQALCANQQGEFAVACLSGIFSLEDALFLVGKQDMLIQERDKDGSSGADEKALLSDLWQIVLKGPQIPCISNATGTWLTSKQAIDPMYWIQRLYPSTHHALDLSQFTQGDQLWVLLPVGNIMRQFTSNHLSAGEKKKTYSIISIAETTNRQHSKSSYLLITLGQLWLAGVSIDWGKLYEEERRVRVPLPTYPFERKRHWIEPLQDKEQKPAGSVLPLSSKSHDPASWFYLSTWQKAELSEHTNQFREASQRKPWLVIMDDTQVGTYLVSHLRAEGQQVIELRYGAQFQQISKESFYLRPQHREDYVALRHTLQIADILPRIIVHAWGITLDAQSEQGRDIKDIIQASQQNGFYSLLFLIQELTKLDEKPVELIVLTDRAQAVAEEDKIHPEQATMIGACKVIAQEYQNISCRCIDIDTSEVNTLADKNPIDAVIVEAISTSKPVEVAYRQGQRWTHSFEPIRLETAQSGKERLRQQGVYLITGGLGGIGLELAHYLARNVQAKLVLVGRSNLPPHCEWESWQKMHENNDSISKKIRQIEAMETLGAEVLLCTADISDEKQMRAVLYQTNQRFGTLHGVIHCAGVTTTNAFTIVDETEPAVCEEHFAAKIYGLVVLEKLLREHTHDFCAVFSSISSVLGGLGFIAYSAAHAFVDAYVAKHNRTEEIPWTCINWSTWLVGSESSSLLPSRGSNLAEAMTPEEGVDAFMRALGYGLPIVHSVSDLQERIRQWIDLEGQQSMSGRPSYGALSLSAAHDNYEQHISAIWKQVLGIEQIGLDDNFFEVGGNSLIGLQVLAQIKKMFGVQMKPVAIFEAPTIRAIARYLQSLQESSQITHRRPLAEELKKDAESTQDIAIIGMAGRFPGASTTEQLWQNIVDGKESITFFSDEELLQAGVTPALLHDARYVKARPVLADIELFDATFFGYDAHEATLMDPQHRLFLECCWQALENAGYDPSSSPGTVGVFGGANISTYMLALASDPSLNAGVDEYALAASNDKDALTTRVSYKLNLRGPSYAVQTFCSSSLVAVHLACQNIHSGECTMALAGGVSIRVPSIAGHLYQEGGVRSGDGHCRIFDARAQGTMYGDGVAVVVLKQLDQALKDGDTVYAVIKGSAVNNDGVLKAGYTATSVSGQEEVITQALSRAQVSAETISYVEAHGAGTLFGDAIEVTAFTKAFRHYTDKTGYCAIGSVKTNIGHLDRASGVTGLIKTVLSLQHGILPAHLHFETANPQIDFSDSPFYINNKCLIWQAENGPHRACVNSLGLGGTNACVIIEEAQKQEEFPSQQTYCLFPISARTEQGLNAAISNLYHYLINHADISLVDAAYTLQVGRKAFEHRDAFVCQSREEALAALEHLTHTRGERMARLVNNTILHDRDLSSSVSLETAMGSWLRGEEVDWLSLYSDERRRRIALPTYPFERQRYWPHISSDINHKYLTRFVSGGA